MFDTDKHYFASKLTTDMSVYVGPTYTMYVGITLFQCYIPVKYVLRWPNVAPTRWPYGGPKVNEQVNVGPTLFYNVGPTF